MNYYKFDLKDLRLNEIKHIMNEMIDDSVKNNSATIIQKYLRGYLIRRPVITIVKSHNFVNINKLKSKLQIEFDKDSDRYKMAKEEGANLKIDSDISEWWVKECIPNGKRVGKGNGPIDVENDEMGIDVACLCLNGDQTNEKSLGQKFKGDGGNSLDIYFNEKKDKLAVELYLNEIKNKYETVKKDKYYYIFISTKSDIYLSIMKINPNNLLLVKSDGFTSQGKSIKISGFIKPKYGKVTLYKSKKRIELRLNKEILKYAHHLFTLM